MSDVQVAIAIEAQAIGAIVDLAMLLRRQGSQHGHRTKPARSEHFITQNSIAPALGDEQVFSVRTQHNAVRIMQSCGGRMSLAAGVHEMDRAYQLLARTARIGKVEPTLRVERQVVRFAQGLALALRRRRAED